MNAKVRILALETRAAEAEITTRDALHRIGLRVDALADTVGKLSALSTAHAAEIEVYKAAIAGLSPAIERLTSLAEQIQAARIAQSPEPEQGSKVSP